MSPKLKTFIERGISTVILLALLGAAVAMHVGMESLWGYAVLVCLLCNLTSYEWFNMLKDRAEQSNRGLILTAGLVYPWLMALGVLLNGADVPLDGGEARFLWVFEFGPVALGALVLYTLVAFFAELRAMDYQNRSGAQALSSMGMTLLAFVYPVWLFAFALSALYDDSAIKTLLWLVLVTKMSDIWAYVSGVLLGGKFISRRFSPVVSPKKTWEGIIGSFIITSICAWALRDLTSFPFELSPVQFFLVLMPCIFVLSVAGDLAGSLIKRGIAVKDSGSLLPGIGGIFDLIDSPAFTVSFFVAVLVIF